MLGAVYSKNCTFKKKFHALLDDLVHEEEFEDRWRGLVAEYNLQENQFMTVLFRIGQCGQNRISLIHFVQE